MMWLICAIPWVIGLVWFAWAIHTAPQGEEIPGVGFVLKGGE